MSRILALLAGALLMTLVAPHSGTAAPVAAPLHGRHAIAVRGGVFNHGSVDVNTGAAGSKVRVTGFAGYASYGYGVAPEWIIGSSVGVLDAEVLSSVTPGAIVSSAASVTPILFEARWYPLAMAMGHTGRPFVGLAMGPYVGSAVNSIAGSTTSAGTVTETALGGRVQVGIDWFLGPRFVLGAAGGYHAVSQFDQQVGTEKNYSGAEVLVGFGILFGTPR